MQELETLLKSLVHKGRKPCGKEVLDLSIEDGIVSILLEDFFADNIKLNLRSIVSLNSGLWQFVCDKQLYKHDQRTDSDWIKNVEDIRDSEKSVTKYLTEADYRYRLLESALSPEQELGKFLVDNIVIEWNSK